MRLAGANPSEAEVDQYTRLLRHSGERGFTARSLGDVLESFYREHPPEERREELSDTFLMIDVDGDGVLRGAEIADLEHMLTHLGEPLSEEELREFLVRREQLTATQAAFSRFSAVGIGGTIERQDLPNFLRYVVTSMSTSALPQAELSARSSELTQQLLGHLPPNVVQLSVSDIMQAAEKVLITPPTSTDDELSSERGNMGSKQLRLLRKKLARNRLTMPLFDTKGWVRDFEKALKIQWEIYANGLSPMHIVVARSDRIYGLEVLTGAAAADVAPPNS